MRFAPVVPPMGLRYLAPTGYHLFLSNIALADARVREFYGTRIRRGDFVIMDNPVHEREQSPSLEQLMAVAAAVRPSAVTILDVIGDPEGTLHNFHQYAPFFRKIPGVEPMGVVQGRNLNEYMQCAYSLAPHCKYLGIPLIRKYEQIDRAAFVQALSVQGFFGDFPGIQVHLLGADHMMNDAITLRSHPRVMGIDSAKPIYLALKGYTMDTAAEDENAWGRPSDYWKTPVEEFEKVEVLLIDNVEVVRNRLSRWDQVPSWQSNASPVTA